MSILRELVESAQFLAKSGRSYSALLSLLLTCVFGTAVLRFPRDVSAAILGPTAIRTARVETEHYIIYFEQGKAEEFALVLEQAYGKWKQFFGSEPRLSDGEKLRVKVCATQESYRQALAAESALDDRTSGAGGCYVNANRTVYIWNQFFPDATRGALLHEGTHQFHLLTRPAGFKTRSSVYFEGVAEYFGMHTWDGQVLQMGASPEIATKDDPAEALARFEQVWKSDLAHLAASTETVSFEGYPDVWALVSFLLEEDPELFRRWAAELERFRPPALAWNETFGQRGAELNKRFLEWLRRQQRPWHAPYGAWQQVGGAIEGRERDLLQAVAVKRGVKTSLDAVIRLRKGGTFAGLVFDFSSDADYSFVAFNGRDLVEYLRVESGEFVVKKAFRVNTTPRDTFQMSIRAAGDETSVSINGTPIESFPSGGGELGLVVHGGVAVFDELVSK